MLETAQRPSYLALGAGELSERTRALRAVYDSCRLCPRACGVNRAKGSKGVCGAGTRVQVASFNPHFGEEAPLVGRGGSGTIFFSRCNLFCVFCQNWTISHRGEGHFLSDAELGEIMLSLQRRGCENINLVTPSHVVPNIVAALRHAVPRGLRVPLVYNCSGYEPDEIIRLLEGIVDIYLPDCKYMDSAAASKYSSGAADYPEVATQAIVEMNRQVGRLVADERGVARRGLIIRHLVLPFNLAGTDQFVKWVARELGPETYINLMAQYRPEFRAREFPELNRRLTPAEFRQALTWAREAGLRNVDGAQ